MPKNSDGVEVFFFPDESQKAKVSENIERTIDTSCGGMTLEHPEMNQALVEDEEIEDDWDEEFCILEEETGNGIPVSS